MKLCSKNDCTGCFACYNSCPVDAIKFIEDTSGFVNPLIDECKCIDCGKCTRVCPELNNKTIYNNPMKVLAVSSKNNEIRSTSTSGGVATELAIQIIRNKGVVYGSAVCESSVVKHIRVDCISDIYKIQGSKYVHSYIDDTYKSVKHDLKNDIEVLFIGTPCQVSGLISYLGKEYDKLTTISFICGGVPSQKFLREEILDKYKNLDVDNIYFRNNNEYGLRLVKNDKVICKVDRWSSQFFIGFDEGIILREGCYSCNYARKDRVGDITIGDFWGLKKSNMFDELEKEKGVSLVMITTIKGNKTFEKSLSKFNIENHTIEEACDDNPRLYSVKERKKQVDLFNSKYNKYGFVRSIKHIYGFKYNMYIIKSFFKRNKYLLLIYRNMQKMVGIKK